MVWKIKGYFCAMWLKCSFSSENVGWTRTFSHWREPVIWKTQHTSSNHFHIPSLGASFMKFSTSIQLGTWDHLLSFLDWFLLLGLWYLLSFLFAFPIPFQLFLIWGCRFLMQLQCAKQNARHSTVPSIIHLAQCSTLCYLLCPKAGSEKFKSHRRDNQTAARWAQ